MLSVCSVWAEPVTESAALQKARAFMTQRGRPLALQTSARAAGRDRDMPEQTADYYVFNIPDNAGFVVVSGDDRTVPILGYADQGAIDINNMPDGLRAMLQTYSAAIEALPDTVRSLSDTDSTVDRAPIAPLIQSHWSQYSPYNLYSPQLQDNGNFVTAPSGCSATAVTQLMYYYQWPQGPTSGIAPYTTYSEHLQMDSLPPVTFDWEHMLLSYDENSDSVSCAAVATLMNYCGHSMKMDYTAAWSGANSFEAIRGLITCFDYDPNVLEKIRYDYTDDEWTEMIYNELAEGHPLFYHATNSEGSHAFICDGYDADNYFHFNWGWGGESDGYFLLADLWPAYQGTGFSRWNDAFNFYHGIWVGLRPRYSNKQFCHVEITNCWLYDRNGHPQTAVYTRDSVSHLYPDTTFIYHSFHINSFDSVLLDVCVQGIDEAGQRYIFFQANNNSVASDGFYSIAWNNLLMNPPVGTYALRLMFRQTGTEEWEDCVRFEQFPATMVVDSLGMTISTNTRNWASPKLLDITTSGPHTVGEMDTVTTRVIGVSYYTDELFLKANGTVIAGTEADVPDGDTVTVVFRYKPEQEGDFVLTVWNNNFLEYGRLIPAGGTDSLIVHIHPKPDDLMHPFTYNAENIEVEFQLDNLDGNCLIGNALKGSFTLNWTATDSSFFTYLFIRGLPWNPVVTDNDTTWNYLPAFEVIYQDAWVPKATPEQPSTMVVPFLFEGLSEYPAEYYSFQFFFRSLPGSWIQIAHFGYTPGKPGWLYSGGYALADAEDNLTLFPEADTVDCRDACYADLRAVDLQNVVLIPSTNLNCCYVLKADALTPSALEGRNIIRNNSAEQIIITDGHDFRPRRDFTADQVQYTRTFQPEAPSTILLPYAPDYVSADYTLKTLDADEYGSVLFTEATTWEPFRPYLITTGDTALTFSASNVLLYAPEELSCESAYYYSFIGDTKHTALEYAYLLNDEGNAFERMEPAVVQPFHAALTGNLISSSRNTTVLIKGSSPGTSFEQIDATTDEPWYTLTGLKLSSKPTIPGAYIHAGKVRIVP